MSTEMSYSETSDERENIKEAARNGQLEKVIELSTKFNDDMKLLSETLIESCRKGHLNVVKWMVEHTAANVNYTGVIKIFFRPMSELNVDDYHTPLTAACHYKHLDVVKYLVEIAHADVNLPDSIWGFSPLITACRCVNISESTFLLSEVGDLDVNFADKKGNTALHFVASYSTNSNRLHFACAKGDVDEVKKLVTTEGHLINEQDSDWNTPLHIACCFGERQIVEILLLEGADKTIVDYGNKTPVQVAARWGDLGFFFLLTREIHWEDKKTIPKTMHRYSLADFKEYINGLANILQQLLIRTKWCQLVTVVYVVLTINRLKQKHHLVKRKKCN